MGGGEWKGRVGGEGGGETENEVSWGDRGGRMDGSEWRG